MLWYEHMPNVKSVLNLVPAVHSEHPPQSSGAPTPRCFSNSTNSRLKMSETLTFDVAYSTSFEDLESLRDKMLKFLEANARDYQTAFDVAVVGKGSIVIVVIYE